MAYYENLLCFLFYSNFFFIYLNEVVSNREGYARLRLEKAKKIDVAWK